MEENYQVIDETMNQTEGLELTNRSMAYFSETRKWAKFLAVLLFIGAGFMVLVSIIFLFTGSLFNSMGGQENPFTIAGPFFGVAMVAFSALYFIPAYFLLQFSNHMKHALREQDSGKLEFSLKNLKSHYKFIGILAIILIVGYMLMGFFTLVLTSF